MKLAALLLLVLPGCTMALAGDAFSACERIISAQRSVTERCNRIPGPGQAAGWCDRAWITNATSDQAAECEAWAAAVACEDVDATYSPACDFTRYP